ncbi:MAG: putative dehydrogenase [Candidatus Promineifilaceae bacterium]|jgi:predicted dehydrogenase
MMKRRDFMKVAAAGSSAALLPEFCYAKDNVRKGKLITDRKINIAAIGAGGKGASDIGAMADENVVALCDVDYRRAEDTFNKFPNAKRYKDFRKMLVEMDDQIDAVTVSTPDHMHFPAAMMAITMGKHVFVQKPMAHTVEEARLLTLAARKHEVQTVMGNQGHCEEGIRLVREWIQSGAIGKVREAHAWTNRPIWPQGMDEPLPEAPIPDTLDWNRWLGVAPERPYGNGYLPFKWRGWWDFGCGALGDMACHTMDAAFWGLDLLYPTSVIAEASGVSEQCAPKSSTVTYEFPARGKMPPVTLTWHDGGNMPPRPVHLEEGRDWGGATGTLIVGENASILAHGDAAGSPRLIPESAMGELAKNPPAKTIPRVAGGPHQEFVRAIKGQGPKPASNFDYAGPFTETVLMGNLAVRMAGQKIKWNGKKMKCTNSKAANALVRKQYRAF